MALMVMLAVSIVGPSLRSAVSDSSANTLGVASNLASSSSSAEQTTAVPSTAVPTTAVPTTAAPATTTSAPTTTTAVPSDQTELVHLLDLTGDLSSKSVVASGHGFYFAQNMMYRHTISVFTADKELAATIPDSVDLSAYGFDVEEGTYMGAPVEAAFSPNGRYAYVSNYRMYGPGFSGGGSDGCNKGAGDDSFVYRVDTETLAIDAVYQVGSVPKFLAVTPDGQRLLVSNWCTFDVSVIDLADGALITEVEVGRHPRGLAITSDGTIAYVAVMGSSDIAVVDLTDYSQTKLEGVGPGPRHLILSPDDSVLYATLNSAGTVVKIDPSTGEILDRVTTGAAPRSMAMSTDGLSLYVVNYNSNTMSKVRTADFEILQEFRTADKPIGITYDPFNDEVWVSAYSGVLHVYAEQRPAG